MAKKERFYLDCPFSDKDEAKGLGAFWDADVRKWYVPDNVDNDLFAKWLPGVNADYQEPDVVEEAEKFFLDEIVLFASITSIGNLLLPKNLPNELTRAFCCNPDVCESR